MKFVTGYSAWEDSDFVVTIRPDFEKSWRSVAIGGALSKNDARTVAEWLQGALPALWKVFGNVATEQVAAHDRGSKAHLGDPCIYCGIPHDGVEVGDCPGR